jgi:hypothetical protein
MAVVSIEWRNRRGIEVYFSCKKKQRIKEKKRDGGREGERDRERE